MISYIAQSFVLDTKTQAKVEGTGAYLIAVDLFFATKDTSNTLVIEIREMDPISHSITNKIVPFSQTFLFPTDINVSDDGSYRTTIGFPSPVYLLNGYEYALVIYSSSGNSNYRLFTAVLGDVDLVSGNKVTNQPATGMLYDTGIPIPQEDLKFNLIVANFDTTVTGSVVFKNQNKDYLVIANVSSGFTRTGEIIHGETLLSGTFANTKTLSVANNTTFAQGMVSGATGTVTSFAAGAVKVKNVSLTAKFKGKERIRFRTNNATTGGIVGNSTGVIVCTTTPTGVSDYYDAVNYSNTHLHLSNTSFSNSGSANTSNRMFIPNMFIRGQTNGYTASILSLNNIQGDLIKFTNDFIQPSNTSLSLSFKMAKSTTTRDTAYQNININTDTELSAPRFVLSRSIESNTSASTSDFNASKSAEFKYTMNSTSRLSSPAIDIGRISLTLVENLINSNSAIGSSEDSVKSGGSAKARYISRQVTLADGQDAEDLKVYVTAYKPSTAGISIYYKILHRDDGDTFADAKWTLMSQNTSSGFTSSSTYSSSENTDDFLEFVYDPPVYTNAYLGGANTSNNKVVEYRNTSRARFVGFKKFAIKIVLSSTTSSKPPRIRDYRAIALQR